MTLVAFPDALRSFSARGRAGFGRGYGDCRRGHMRYGASTPDAGIYQVRHKRRTQEVVRMRFYRPTNPQSVPQEANRSKFASGMAAWGGLTDGERTAYTIRAKRRNMFGWGLFLRDYMSSH